MAQRGRKCKDKRQCLENGGRHSRGPHAQYPGVFRVQEVQQAPAPEPSVFDAATTHLLELGWIDKTALSVLVVFFLLGLFKGLFWQVSRIGILCFSYYVAGYWGRDVATLLAESEDAAAAAGQGSSAAADVGAREIAAAPPDTTLYLSYCVLFVSMVIVLSLLSMVLKRFIVKAGLGFFDRLGGGVFGVATGSLVVLFLVLVMHMVSERDSQFVRAAKKSHAVFYTRQAIQLLDRSVDNQLREQIGLEPLADTPLAEAPPADEPVPAGIGGR